MKTIRPTQGRRRGSSPRRRWPAALIALGSIGLVGHLLSGASFERGWRSFRGDAREGHTAASPVGPRPGAPSKEYIYAGTRLVAVEEWDGVGLAAPTGLEAAGGSGALIRVRWSATPNAARYQVERGSNLRADFTVVSSDADPDSFTDSPPEQGRAYLYRVRAADAAGNLSPPSNADLATAVAFTDDPLQRRTTTSEGTTIKAEHLTQLRQAVNAVRALAELPPASWTHPDPEPAQRRNVSLADVLELRSNLDAALDKLGMRRPFETDPDLSGGPVRAAHFQELRDRVK